MGERRRRKTDYKILRLEVREWVTANGRYFSRNHLIIRIHIFLPSPIAVTAITNNSLLYIHIIVWVTVTARN